MNAKGGERCSLPKWLSKGISDVTADSERASHRDIPKTSIPAEPREEGTVKGDDVREDAVRMRTNPEGPGRPPGELCWHE